MTISNGKVEVDDLVKFRSVSQRKKLWDDGTYIVKGIPRLGTPSRPFWTLLGEKSGKLIVVSGALILEVLTP